MGTEILMWCDGCGTRFSEGPNEMHYEVELKVTRESRERGTLQAQRQFLLLCGFCKKDTHCITDLLEYHKSSIGST